MCYEERLRKARGLAKTNTTRRKGIARTLGSCVVSPAKRVLEISRAERAGKSSPCLCTDHAPSEWTPPCTGDIEALPRQPDRGRYCYCILILSLCFLLSTLSSRCESTCGVHSATVPSTLSLEPLHVLRRTTFDPLSVLQGTFCRLSIGTICYGGQIPREEGQFEIPDTHEPETLSDRQAGDTHVENCFRGYMHAPAGPVLERIS